MSLLSELDLLLWCTTTNIALVRSWNQRELFGVTPRMKRVLVIGSPGAGKSVFSRRLGEITGLPVIHLDQHYWRPGWIEPSKDVWSRQVTELLQRDSWIIDGNYS